MVKRQRQIAIILILALTLSLVPNFLYTKSSASTKCPPGCTEKAEEGKGEEEEQYCINCPITCQWQNEEVTNKSCLPWKGTGKWTCGTEIPVGEVMDRSAYLAGRMLAEFGGIVKGGRQMVASTDELLDDYKDWNCDDWCETGCHKYFYITEGQLQRGEDPLCPAEAQEVPKGIYAGDECKANAAQCQSCAQCGERCCWEEEYVPDPEFPRDTITCKYCRKIDACQEVCSPDSCTGCCGQYFWPIINGYEGMEELQEALKNDVEEKTPDGEDLPENFKFKRSYISEQLDFSRCKLAECWVPAEDYYEVLMGEKVGRLLLTCETVAQSGFLDDDQIICSALQTLDEWEAVEDLWEEMETAPWWQKPVVLFQIFGKTIEVSGKIIWEMINEWFTSGEEEGCYPTNYYCCHM